MARIKETTNAELWTQSADAERKYKLNRMMGVWEYGLGKKILHFGGNSGYQAVNLAFLFGAARIILLGFDMQRTNDQPHFFGKHPYHGDKSTPSKDLLKDWVKKFKVLAKDLEAEQVEVINATRETALTCFKRLPIDQC